MVGVPGRGGPRPRTLTAQAVTTALQHLTPKALEVIKQAIANGDAKVALEVIAHVKGRAAQTQILQGGAPSTPPIRIVEVVVPSLTEEVMHGQP